MFFLGRIQPNHNCFFIYAGNVQFFQHPEDPKIVTATIGTESLNLLPDERWDKKVYDFCDDKGVDRRVCEDAYHGFHYNSLANDHIQNGTDFE